MKLSRKDPSLAWKATFDVRFNHRPRIHFATTPHTYIFCNEADQGAIEKMAQALVQTIHRDPQLFYWILIPITIVMILTGILRHYATVLMATTPKKQELPAIREQRSLIRGINLRNNAHVLTPAAFQPRKDYLVQAFEEGKFLKEPEKKGQAAPNPMTDPAAMEGMMGMMKGNMSMMIPQTLIMGWINAFFSGFVISWVFPGNSYSISTDVDSS
ncbi:hypothetical protein NHQ30_000968 [Ciborinia camelliae]|nr:hypothetical protein NHQ30_000968 [Ciborinia camelliae]